MKKKQQRKEDTIQSVTAMQATTIKKKETKYATSV